MRLMQLYQRQLVKCAVELLRPGGTLVYSTCEWPRLGGKQDKDSPKVQTEQMAQGSR